MLQLDRNLGGFDCAVTGGMHPPVWTPHGMGAPWCSGSSNLWGSVRL